MWTSIVIAAATVCGGPAESGASPADSQRVRCVQQALRRIPPGHAVMLTCRDGSQAKGQILGLDDSQGLIRILPDPASPGLTPAGARYEPLALPAAGVMRLTWSERGGKEIVGGVLGLLIGGATGLVLGAAAAPHEHSLWAGLDELAYAVTGAAIGGTLGLALGVIAGASSRHWHSADCWDGSGVPPDH